MAIFQALLVGRWAMLLLILPYALAWGRSMESGGVLAALTLAAAVLYYFATVDARLASSSGQLRFALHRSRNRVDRLALDTAKPLFAGAAAVLGLVLLAVSPWLGLAALLSIAIVALLDLSPRRYPMRLVEFAIPLGVLVLPLMIARLVSDRVQSAEGTVHLILIGAFMLAGFIVLCLARDEQLDRGEGRMTTAVIFGSDGALLFFLLYAASAIGILIMGVAMGLWAWPTASVLPAAAMAAVWLAAMKAPSTAAALWFLAGAVVAVLLNVNTLHTIG
jgi:4-hydroxybenzoate polyprenyltransferase